MLSALSMNQTTKEDGKLQYIAPANEAKWTKDRMVMDPPQPHFLLWAKSNPPKNLLTHMLETGCCAEAFLSAPSSRSALSFLTEQWHCEKEDAVAFSAYLAALHDLGKAMPHFQRQNEQWYEQVKGTELGDLLPAQPTERIEHEHFSALIIKDIWKKNKQKIRLYRPYACVLSLHHQRMDTTIRRLAIPDAWVPIQEALEAEIRQAFNPPEHLMAPDCMDAVCVFLTGFVILCDWVASSASFDDMPRAEGNDLTAVRERARKTLEAYGLIEHELPGAVPSFTDLWPQIQKPRDIQKLSGQLNAAAPLTIIEAPMGEGKTEAALYLAQRMRAAWNKRGIYVALPTQATSNQMYERTRAMLHAIQGGRARLLHGTAFLKTGNLSVHAEHDAAEAERWFISPLRMGLLDENGVGTVDQAMAGVLLSRFSVLRLLGLTEKVLIIDELHAYDAYMQEILQALLSWCRALRIPVILLSATLQNSQREAYLSCFAGPAPLPALSSAYPLITQVDENGRLSEFEAEAAMHATYAFRPLRLGEDCAAIARHAVSRIQGGGCFCVLVNTVKRAQDVYRALLEIKDTDTETLLFHARFPMGRREEIEQTCLNRFGKGPEANRPRKAILVATQVVEQSLDLDFDGMLTELAPIDLLLQRAGRVHRHRERVRPQGLEEPAIQVILPEEGAPSDLEKRYGNSGFVYAPFLLNNTEHLIENGMDIRVPGEVRAVIARVYEQVTPENRTAWQERAFHQQLMHANAKGSAFPVPDDDIFFADESKPEFLRLEADDGFEPAARASTRLGEPTVRVAFSTPDLLEAAIKERLTESQRKEILLSSVSLPARKLPTAFLQDEKIWYRMKKSALRGCYVSADCDIIKTETFVLVNDRNLGVLYEE
ncbi:MAG: CRISPR-associated helicase Cas3' [Clostridia bacterium]|nr:CRISPR-associated helicase Cas3' [Clostridia bacterium]